MFLTVTLTIFFLWIYMNCQLSKNHCSYSVFGHQLTQWLEFVVEVIETFVARITNTVEN